VINLLHEDNNRHSGKIQSNELVDLNKLFDTKKNLRGNAVLCVGIFSSWSDVSDFKESDNFYKDLPITRHFIMNKYYCKIILLIYSYFIVIKINLFTCYNYIYHDRNFKTHLIQADILRNITYKTLHLRVLIILLWFYVVLKFSCAFNIICSFR
jgi:hypothetical protein